MRTLRPHALLGIAAIALTCTPACSEKQQQPQGKPRPVVTVTVGAPSAVTHRSFSGLLQPSQGVDISFEVGGRIVDIPAKRGVRYSAGDVLARLDSSDYQSQLSGAQAELIEAGQSKNRTQKLFESGNSSKSELETAVAREQSARTKFESAQKKVDDCTLLMPYEGVVSDVIADPQSIVQPGEPAISLQGDGAMEFVIGLPAAEVSEITLGMPSTIKLGSLPELALPAKVSEIATQPKDNTTYPVVLVVQAELDPAVRAGMDGEATLALPNKTGPAIQVPIECVVGRGEGGEYVWVIDGEAPNLQAVRRPVTIGNLTPGGTVEISSGLQPGEVVVSRGAHRVEEGMEVTVSDQP